MAGKKTGKRGGQGRRPGVKGGELVFNFKPLSSQIAEHSAFLKSCKDSTEVRKAIEALDNVAAHFTRGTVCPQEQFITIKPR
jgi:hypothetical protein